MPTTENVLQDLLRVLTPEEIAKLIESSEKKERISLTETLHQDLTQKAQNAKKHNVAKFEENATEKETEKSEEKVEEKIESSNDAKTDKKELKKGHEEKVKKEIDNEPANTPLPENVIEDQDENVKASDNKTSKRGISIFGEEEEVVVEEKVDIVDFILEEQKKSKVLQDKLQEREILDSYEKGASVIIQRSTEDSKKDTKLTSYGILINKRRK